MSDNNINKNTGFELNYAQTGNKKTVKQKGEQNNYFEIDYREKYYNAKDENFLLKEKIQELNQKLNQLDDSYVEYRFNMNTDAALVNKLEEELGKNNITFASYFYKIFELPGDINIAKNLYAMKTISIKSKNVNKFIEIWKTWRSN